MPSDFPFAEQGFETTIKYGYPIIQLFDGSRPEPQDRFNSSRWV
jgi:hypothetical protein